MKPAAVINRGENFVTLRATTDRPAEIQEALATRDVQHVFKGDQNQVWDAVLANHCLARAVGDSGAEITFFVQDERLGTADSRLTRAWKQQGRRYVLTEDYYRGRAGAVWEHQDTTHGLFFTEAVSPEQYASASIHFHRAALLWEKHAKAILPEASWVHALAELGVALPNDPAGARPDAATALGPGLHRDEIRALGEDHPAAALFYAYTKTDGLYGIVPVENANEILSSISAHDPELKAAGTWLLVRAAAAGAMRLAAGAGHRKGVAARARRVADWASEYLSEHPHASVADFQIAFGQWLTREVFPADRFELDRTSRFTGLDASDLEALRRPEQGLHFFLDLALRHPREFTEAYNEALNRVGFGLQRMKFDPQTGHYTPPFFVEFAPAGPGTPIYRYGLELTGVECTTIVLRNEAAGSVEVRAEGPVRSAHALLQAILAALPEAEGLAIVGKAAAFAAELQRAPRGLGLPRQGSKYAPMVDHLVGGLRARGILRQNTGLLIRIGLNALDRLDAMGELPLRLPRFLQGPLGKVATARTVAVQWRRIAGDAHRMLELLGRCHVGQHVHLARLMVLNARGGDREAALHDDRRLRKLAEQLRAVPDGDLLLHELGRDLPLSVAAEIERLLDRRAELLAVRHAAYEQAAEGQDSGRICPEISAEVVQEREKIECQLLLLFAAYVRRLWQRAESLPYLNDRPYTLALYLLFGRDIFPPICRQVEFDVEYVSPCPMSGEPSPCVEHCSA